MVCLFFVFSNFIIKLRKKNLIKFIRFFFFFFTEVFLEKYTTGFNVKKLFLDPTGHHLLITLSPKSPTNQSAELLYLHNKSSKPKRIDKFKDHEITAVAFNYDNNSENTTGPILIGTNRGLIFETEFGIDNNERMFQSNWKQVNYNLNIL